MVYAAKAVAAVDLGQAVDGARVEARALVGGVLDLQTRFYVLDGRGDEGYGPAGEGAGEGVAVDRQGALLGAKMGRVEDVVVEDAAVDAEGA